MSKFSNRLRELRNTRGLSQQKLADNLKTSKSSVNMYERGDREPGLEMLETIADFFNVDMDYLIGKSNVANKMLYQLIPEPNNPQKSIELSAREEIFVENYRQLTEEGKIKAEIYIEDLLGEKTVYRAARSADNHPAEITTLTSEEQERIANATRITPENGDF